MPTIEQAMQFLQNREGLEEDSPWKRPEAPFQAHLIDWQALFPRNRRNGEDGGIIFGEDLWNFEISDEETSQLLQALQSDPPSKQEEHDFSTEGWDICAWYQPIHYYGTDWGIFIKEQCIHHIALKIAPYFSKYNRTFHSHYAYSLYSTHIIKQLWRAAIYIHFLHEHYHHKIECLGFRLEVIEQRAVYVPYHRLIYQPEKGKDSQLEEALANADAYHRLTDQPYVRWIGRVLAHATRDFLKAYFPINPPGYRRAVDYLTPGKFDQGENLLQAQMKELCLSPTQRVEEWDLAPRMTQSFFRVDSNIWTVVPPGTIPRLPTRPPMP